MGHGNSNALTLLGVTASSVYLSNCTIWVEGITDKLYLSKYLEVYLNSTDIEEEFKNCINFKEGLHYSFVYSAGDSIIHYEFREDNEEEDKVLVKNLCSKAMVIVDNDNNKNTTRKNKLREILGDANFIELPVIEIENLLSLDIIKKTIKSYKTCAKIKDDEFKVIEDKLRKKIRLGTLIEKHILKDINLPNRKKFSVTSNKKKKITKNENLTINDKVDFCKKSLSHITYENLTIEAKKTVKEILNFIKENNPDLK